MKKLDQIIEIDGSTDAGPDGDDTPKELTRPKRKELRRALGAVDIAERIEVEERQQLRTEALAMGRALALAGLPCKPTDQRSHTQRVRFGADHWVTVSIAATVDGVPLPYGSDRYVLAGIQHLAIEQGSPFVTFSQAGELLRMFGLPSGGDHYGRLRARLHRVAASAISIELTGNEKTGMVDGLGYRLIKRYALPTRRARQENQLTFPGMEPHYVRLSEDWWEYLQSSPEALLIVRLDLLRQFVDRPTAWDYLCFLTHRCGAARRESVVPHDALMSLFRRGKERERKTIERLRRVHDEVMTATGGRLNASLEVVDLERKGRGQPRKLWGLRVAPSMTTVLSGAKPKPELGE